MQSDANGGRNVRPRALRSFGRVGNETPETTKASRKYAKKERAGISVQKVEDRSYAGKLKKEVKKRGTTEG